jgi:hypothetical protein
MSDCTNLVGRKLELPLRPHAVTGKVREAVFTGTIIDETAIGPVALEQVIR